MKRLQVLTLEALHRDEAHCRPTGRFEDCLCVGGVVLGSTCERLDETGVDQAHRPPFRLKQAPPIMRTAAGLHRDHSWVKAIDGRDQLPPADFPRDDDSIIVDPEDVKRLLTDVEGEGVQGDELFPPLGPATMAGLREASIS